MYTYSRYTGNMRQLVVDRRICCCSQFMIFLFELLGPAKQPMACPSSSNRKIMNWEQQQILLSTHNCPLYLWFKRTQSKWNSKVSFSEIRVRIWVQVVSPAKKWPPIGIPDRSANQRPVFSRDHLNSCPDSDFRKIWLFWANKISA